MMNSFTRDGSAMSEAELDHKWVFEIHEDAEGREIERRALYSTPRAVDANAWLDSYTRALGANGPDDKGRMWVTNPEDPDITLFYAVGDDDGSAARNLRKAIGVR